MLGANYSTSTCSFEAKEMSMNGANALSTPGISPVVAQAALTQAHQLLAQKKIRFLEWENEWHGWEKLDLDLDDFKQAVEDNHLSKEDHKLRMGNIFLTLVKICGWYGLNAEESLFLALTKSV
jgi:uncharacterized protein YabN with tetrapyrrole methylase and pyrophosphatase domain